MISDITTTLNMLRQEAAAIGITEEEAKKYGNIRHRRTWSLAIEHHLSMQGEADRQKPPATPHHPDSSVPNPQASGNIGESRKPEVELTANLCESQLKIENQTASPSEMLTAPQQQVKQPVRSSYSKSAQRVDGNRGFQQVVQNHIKALKTASASHPNSPYSQLSNWVCPECGPDGEISCHLCDGEGDVSDIVAIGWTLAYMEMLGCSAKEIEPLRRFGHDSNILEVNLKVCVAIKKSTEVLARTQKWLIGNR